jgi:hypothetical protein
VDCPGCSRSIPETSRFCPSCGRGVVGLSALTTERAGRTPPPVAPRLDPTPGRFGPGYVLAGRYRIVELVGKGGMGEVYHADDLTLGQPVALKLLPSEVSANPDMLKRFRGEVRVAREITHPNVCRVYDIGESGRLTFLSMEFIRGEDLQGLLRRIGRLPPDKAVEIAGQLASGLAAAHQKGVLHRDLKPANVMIDEQGQARIMDFGLAAAVGQVDTRDIRSGTPAYMAPEQRAGEEVTERSDVYSLGLVLYELFTGRRALGGASDEPALPGKDVPIAPPSRFVEGLDPAVERVILHCLERDPKRRPSSAVFVRAALPGGDAIAVAVARGETPAPALVAEAGTFTGLAPTVAWACLAGVVASLAVVVWLGSQSQLSQIVPLPRSPALLVADARSILESLGRRDSALDSTFGFSRETGYIEHLMKQERSPSWWRLLARGEPSAIRFWYRESPRYLVPHRITEFFPSEQDPPLTVPGMVSVELDSRGRLRRLQAVPVPGETAENAGEVEWAPLLAAAGLEPGGLSPARPEWPPSTGADRTLAWKGNYPSASDIPIRVEAASFAGRPVSFRVVEPWTPRGGEAEGGGSWTQPSDAVTSHWARLAHVSLHLLLMLALALLARRNLRLGRGDRRLAFRLACVFFTLVMLQWTLGAHHIPANAQLEVFFGGLYRAFFASGMAWLFYIALEPYARKLWPRTMISWVRLLDGRFRDPRVGRDVLVGCLFGVGGAVVTKASRLAPLWLGAVPGRPDIPPHPAELLALRGVKASLAELFAVQVNIATHVLFLFVALLALRFLCRRTWLAVAVHGTLYTLVYAFSGFGAPILLWISVWYVIFFRFGWVSILVGTLTGDLLNGYPLTTDLSAWYAHGTILVVLVCLGLAVYGFKVSLGGRPAFGDLLAEA